jgi:hypothetical protein
MVEYGDQVVTLNAPPSERKPTPPIDPTRMPDAGFLDPEGRLRNYAADEETGKRSVQTVRDVVQRHHNSHLPFYERWAITYWNLSSNTLDQKGPTRVHIPQLYKSIETGKPRIRI